MKILSEKTNKYYDTVEDCIAAEKEFDAKVLAEQKKKDELAAVRKARADEVEKAYQNLIEVKKTAAKAVEDAKKEYSDKLTAFCKDYGQFHMTLKTGIDNPFDAFDIFDWFRF